MARAETQSRHIRNGPIGPDIKVGCGGPPEPRSSEGWAGTVWCLPAVYVHEVGNEVPSQWHSVCDRSESFFSEKIWHQASYFPIWWPCLPCHRIHSKWPWITWYHPVNKFDLESLDKYCPPHRRQPYFGIGARSSPCNGEELMVVNYHEIA